MSSAVLGRSAVLTRPRREVLMMHLGAVHRPRELEDRGGDVLADDRVEGAAEVLGQLPEPCDVVGAGTHGAVATHDVHGHECTARTATGDPGIRAGAASRPRVLR